MEPSEDFEPVGEPTEGDALDHLWTAAHEMLRALRLVIDAADEFVASQRGARPAPWETSDPDDARDADARRGRGGRVRHIDIDVRSDAEAEPANHPTGAQ